MKKYITLSIVLVFFILVGFLELSESEEHRYQMHAVKQVNVMSKEEGNYSQLLSYKNAVWKYVNEDVQMLENDFGQPKRIDPSLYGYEWWIYQEDDMYLQVGVLDGIVSTIYSPSTEIDLFFVQMGQSVEEIKGVYEFRQNIEFDKVRFSLTEKDVKERPVIQVKDGIFAQLYLDTFTEKLTGIRLMNEQVFTLHRPYELYYWGELLEAGDVSKEKWEKIEKGMEKQIFELTNIFRKKHEKPEVKWDDNAANAAKSHSKDMLEEKYFSHYSQNGDGLKERLERAEAYFLSAGENIAAQYVDAPAAMHGWLNSKGHREALLREEYTHLGVGSKQLYYTQNFLEK
ncbi:CAP domain-containing protein [Gracilibacillus sp. YIM 98692]|uniref:CAP domain-containing protein n=1 Tax=Gracilibacillus sp. YIM 98692 TaxID=2663532 RepID=UPI0013CF6E95|nr:CAP domain-containing protein [Gracilibacillus sp. YIM 98692]